MEANAKKIMAQLESKKARLQKVLNTNPPVVESIELLAGYERRRANATNFLSELEDVSLVLELDSCVKLVTRSTLEKFSEKADFCSVEFDGEFCKLVLIQNFPFDDLWLLYVSPVEAI